MVLSFFLGIGLAIVVGYVTVFGGRGSATTGISIAFMIASILIMVFVVLGLRVERQFRSRFVQTGSSARHRCDPPASIGEQFAFHGLQQVCCLSGSSLPGCSWRSFPGGLFSGIWLFCFCWGRFL